MADENEDDYFAEFAGLKSTDNAGGDDNGAPDKPATVEAPADNNEVQPEDAKPNTEQSTSPKDDNKDEKDEPSGLPAGVIKDRNGQFVDKEGNLYDEKGNLIARAGADRNRREQVMRMRTQLDEANRAITELRTAQAEVQLLNGMPARFGLSNDDVAQAIDIAAKVKRGDAIGAAKDVVAILLAAGHNVSELFAGENVGDSVDMRAVRSMIDEALAPQRERTQLERREQEEHSRAVQQMREFFDMNDYAEMHQDAIASLAKRDGINPQQAYNRLREFAYQNGLDFSRELGPQVKEKVQQLKQQKEQPALPPQQQQSTTQPRLNGRTPSSEVRTATEQYASPDDDWNTIITRAMAANGINR